MCLGKFGEFALYVVRTIVSVWMLGWMHTSWESACVSEWKRMQAVFWKHPLLHASVISYACLLLWMNRFAFEVSDRKTVLTRAVAFVVSHVTLWWHRVSLQVHSNLIVLCLRMTASGALSLLNVFTKTIPVLCSRSFFIQNLFFLSQPFFLFGSPLFHANF